LDLPTLDLASLDSPFSNEEIWQEICLMPQDKAPGPDGFTGHFFKKVLANDTSGRHGGHQLLLQQP
jgi:hypothetical protein